jgi:4-hydroxy-tetrahydrodipicolinate reductase
MEVRPIRVVQYGLGESGRNIARLIQDTPGLLLVGGIDSNPELVGQDLGSVLALDRELGLKVSSDPESVINAAYPDVVVLATLPTLNDTYPQIATCLRARVNVVSTCEELVYPHVRHPELSQQLNSLAQRGGVSVVGAGVNPGFVQDLLPLVLTAPCKHVERITSTRVFDASLRRATLHQRVGAGLSPDEFRHNIIESNRMPHYGLRESLHLMADRIGWTLDRVDEKVEPIIADEWIRSGRVPVAPGQVSGATQTAIGYIHGHDVLVLTWQVAIGSPETYDEIKIEGVPPMHLRIDGGIHGGDAAPALVMHTIPPTVAASPGLHTVAELPPLHYRMSTFSSPWDKPA